MMKHVEIRMAIKALVSATDTNYASMDELLLRAKSALKAEGLKPLEYERTLRLVQAFLEKAKFVYKEGNVAGIDRKLPKPTTEHAPPNPKRKA